MLMKWNATPLQGRESEIFLRKLLFSSYRNSVDLHLLQVTKNIFSITESWQK